MATEHDTLLEAGMSALSDAMWTQRRQLSACAYKASVARLILAADDRANAARALEELEQAVRELRAGDSEVNKLVRALARHLELEPRTMTLRSLAALVPGRHAERLEEHAQATAAIATNLAILLGEDRALADAALGQVRATMSLVTGAGGAGAEEPFTYDSRGRRVDGDHVGLDALI